MTFGRVLRNKNGLGLSKLGDFFQGIDRLRHTSHQHVESKVAHQLAVCLVSKRSLGFKRSL